MRRTAMVSALAGLAVTAPLALGAQAMPNQPATAGAVRIVTCREAVLEHLTLTQTCGVWQIARLSKAGGTLSSTFGPGITPKHVKP